MSAVSSELAAGVEASGVEADISIEACVESCVEGGVKAWLSPRPAAFDSSINAVCELNCVPVCSPVTVGVCCVAACACPSREFCAACLRPSREFWLHGGEGPSVGHALCKDRPEE